MAEGRGGPSHRGRLAFERCVEDIWFPATYPIVLPPLTRDDAKRQIGDVQMGVLSTNAEIEAIFDELHARLAQDLKIQTKVTAWNREIVKFKQQLPSSLAALQAGAAAPPLSPLAVVARTALPADGSTREI